jgi:hypothetical protein
MYCGCAVLSLVEIGLIVLALSLLGGLVHKHDETNIYILKLFYLIIKHLKI